MLSREDKNHKVIELSVEEIKEFWADKSNIDDEDKCDADYSVRWAGGTSQDLDDWLEKGNKKDLAKVLALTDKVHNNLQLNIAKKSNVVKGHYGGCVNVPAALVNHPRAFYRRQLVSKPGLRVYLGLNASAGYSAAQIQKNVVAYIGFVKYLTLNYNVELYLSWNVNNYEGKKFSQITPIGLSPFDWGQLLALTHSNCFRRAIFSLRRTHGKWNGIKNDGLGYTITNLKESMGEFLHIQKQDIVLSGMLLGESDPETWVHKQIKKLEEENAR